MFKHSLLLAQELMHDFAVVAAKGAFSRVVRWLLSCCTFFFNVIHLLYPSNFICICPSIHHHRGDLWPDPEAKSFFEALVVDYLIRA